MSGKIDDLYREMGTHIKRARKENRLTQARLAEMVGLSRTSVTNIEQGRQKLLVHTLNDIALALAVDPGDLFPERLSSAAPPTNRDFPAGLSAPERHWIESLLSTPARRHHGHPAETHPGDGDPDP